MPASVFLSHAHENRSIARDVYHTLVNAGIRCWLDEAEISPGESIMGKVEDAIDEMDILAVVLSRASVNSSWVRAELRMAMTEELKEAHVRVVGLVVDDCRIPGFLRDKLYIDLRADFSTGVERLLSFLRGDVPTIAKPPQAILADFIASADDELWGRYSRRSLRQSDFAQLVRTLGDDEIVAAVEIAQLWRGYKAWEDGLLGAISRRTGRDDPTAAAILRRLVSVGLLEPATDLDYTRQRTQAYTDGDGLIPLRRFAIKSRAFDFLPAPRPDRLSEVLAAVEPITVGSRGWYALSFGVPLVRRDAAEPVQVVVQRYAPERAWIFASAEDRRPTTVNERRASSGWTKDPFADAGAIEHVGLELARFDDLGLLT